MPPQTSIQLHLNMKKILYAMLVMAVSFGFAGCRDEDNLPYPKAVDYPIIFTTLTTGQNTFSLTDIAGTGNPTVTLNLDVKGGNLQEVETIEVYRSFRGFNVAATPALGLGPRVLLRTVAPNSGALQLSLNDIVSGLTRATANTQTGTRTALTRASLKETEGFLFTYELLLKDGRRIVYTPLSNGIVSGSQAAAPYAGLVTVVK